VDGNPNLLAWVSLILVLPVSMATIALWRPAVSVPILILAGQMFLPSVMGFNVPWLLPIDKDVIVPLSALIGVAIIRPKSLAGARPGTGLDLFIVLRIFGLLGSCLTNQDPLVFPKGVVPGLSMLTFASNSVSLILYWWPTVFLGRTLIKTSADLRTLFVILTGAAIIYSFFIALEMRFSPQLNVWIYGYHQSGFMMAIRGGKYRPMVFMRHGLNLALFVALSIVAASALGKLRARVFRLKARTVAIFLLVLLVLCHSLGALLYAIFAMPLVWFARARTQARVATVIAFLAFCYPVARTFDLVPVDDINNFVLNNFGEERAGSLGLRLSEEAVIMRRALERIVFGWGGGARSFRLDPITGANTSTTDGTWAIEIGQHGAVGFIGMFGMLLYPVWRSRRAVSRLKNPQDRILVSALALIGAIYMADLIPNSSVDPYITFLTAVLGGIGSRGLEDPYADTEVATMASREAAIRAAAMSGRARPQAVS